MYSILKLFLFFPLFSLVLAQSELIDLKDLNDKMKKTNQKKEVSIDSEIDSPSTIFLEPRKFKNELSDSLRKNKYFGYNFFERLDTLSFFENMPPPRSYVLGPGDELIISIWGENQVRTNYTIAKDGTIYDEKVGLLNPSGLNINEANDYIKKQFTRVYATLGSRNPTSFFSLSLGNLKSINVNFVGKLNNPGVYAIHPFSNLITGLIQIGGVDTVGTLRKIEIKRKDKPIILIDLYKYLLEGSLPEQIELKDQDIVKISTRKSTVHIDSAVYNPGIYECLDGESIEDLINFAGGLKPTASENISVKRIIPLGQRTEMVSSKNFYIKLKDAKNTKLFDGDQIAVLNMLFDLNYVELIGQVKRPGKYNFFKSMTISDIFNLGGGFEDSTFLKTVYLPRAEIVRRDPSTMYEKVIEVDLKSFLSGTENPIFLENLDRIVVHENINFYENKTISVFGEVNVPGHYPLIFNGENLESLINRAGGFTNNALKNGVQVFRDANLKSLKNKDAESARDESSRFQVAWENLQIPLMPGDSIIVKKTTRTVNIIGEVFNPGIIEIKPGRGVSYYINQAGGITPLADPKGIIIVYANGRVKPKTFFSNPKVSDGSTIVINSKEIVDPFDLTQFATNWTSILSSMITAIILSRQL